MVRHLILITLFSMMAGKAIAEDRGCCDCPDCGNKVCIGKAVPKKESKTVYAIEKKDICIPKIRFPWQLKSIGCGSGCDAAGDGKGCNGCAGPLCGRVKTVKVLKKKKIECDKCGYKWEITDVESEPCCRPFSNRRTICDDSGETKAK